MQPLKLYMFKSLAFGVQRFKFYCNIILIFVIRFVVEILITF